jgi:predicted transposase YbfD/YdcC
MLFAATVILTKKRESILTVWGKETPFSRIFTDVSDPRRTGKGNYRHSLSDIVLLVLSAVLCGANDWEEIEQFGQEQEIWLRDHGEFKNGIPSHDTINRVFSKINPTEFSTCFSAWTNSLRKRKQGRKEVIAIDGKCVRNSHADGKKSSALHMVSAWAVDNNLCLGQVATVEKSNEISAIPELLSLLDIEGDLVSIDAMGCQKKIAEKIIEDGADYLLAVKGNQLLTEESIKDTILFIKPDSEDVDVDCGHGRIETRKCRTYTDFTYFENADQWKNIHTLVEIEAERILKSSGKRTTETRLYISSLNATAEKFNGWIRSHWAVENKLHWVLDVSFKEDLSRKRKESAAKNFHIVLKTAMTLLAKDKVDKASYKKKRARAALNQGYRNQLLNF